jgi:hypothetical protein
MKNLHLKTLFIGMSLSLVGCAATDNIVEKFSSKESARPIWADEALISGEQCDTLTVENIQSFLIKYSQATELESGSKEIGDEAMNTYTLASVLINRSQLCLSQALALKSTTENLLKEKEILLGGTSLSKKEIEQHREYSQAASMQIKAATEQVDSLEPEQRKSLILGITTYLSGTYTTMKIKKVLNKYVDKTSDQISTITSGAKTNFLSSAIGVVSGSLNNALSDGNKIYNIVTGLPEHGKSLYETGTYFIDYAKQQDLDLPTDTTEDFLSTTDW